MVIPPEGSETKNNNFSAHTPWVIRNGFSHGGMALLWIFIAFLLFQICANVLGVVLIIIRMGGELNTNNMMEAIGQNMDLIFVANSVGQIVFLAFCTWFYTKLHTRKANRPSFLRFQFFESTPKMLGLAFVLILTIQPLIWFLGWINAFLPIPESLEAMQMQQMEMIQTYLTDDGIVLIALFNIAMVPAFCEEVLFRGYVQRSFEKSWGIAAAIIISGLIFGAYHLQPSNVLPLASIGILLAVLTWVSQSIYPAMLAHFVNNGASVLFARFYPEMAFAEISPETMPPLWLVGVSVIVSGYLIYWLINNRIKESVNQKGESDATRA